MYLCVFTAIGVRSGNDTVDLVTLDSL